VLLGYALLPGVAPAVAHVLLDPDHARQLLSDIASHHGAAREGVDEAARLEALFRLGEAAATLTEALNRDLAAHGTPDLFAQLVVKRLEAYEVDVRLTEGTQRWIYDSGAFKEYLRRAPHGRRAPDARFKLIARAFHDTLGTDPAHLVGAGLPELVQALQEEERFLAEHPRHERAAEVRFFLAVDYYRAARNASDPAMVVEYERRARRALAAVVKGTPQSVEARAAETLLERLGAGPEKRALPK
jgi:hypothetical protein